MLDETTAKEIASMLQNMATAEPPPMTGALSLLDENTMKWAQVHPEVAVAQAKFAAARHSWWPGDPRRDTPEALTTVRFTALTLAAALAPYGDEKLPLCGRPSVYGPCRAVVLDGECTYGTMAHPEGGGET